MPSVCERVNCDGSWQAYKRHYHLFKSKDRAQRYRPCPKSRAAWARYYRERRRQK